MPTKNINMETYTFGVETTMWIQLAEMKRK